MRTMLLLAETALYVGNDAVAVNPRGRPASRRSIALDGLDRGL